MALPNIFDQQIADGVILRINKLTPNTQRQWGKMNVSQMMAHCNVPYEMVYENKYSEPNALMVWILTWLVKNTVVSEKPYAKNSKTAPAFLIKGDKDFEVEKKRLVDYIIRTQQLGENHFNGRKSHSFGQLTITEWNNMFYKHLNHHLNQFGV